jgi:PIN domain nuclease of toxin-antitoxin system
MTRILLDTTYLFPFAGIDIQGVERDAIGKATAVGHQLFISELSLFELAAKGAKLVANGSAEAERLVQTVQAIVSDETLRKVRLYEEGTLPLAIALRQHHSDFIDCVILASAASTCDMLVTEDDILLRSKEVIKLARRTNPGFLISNFKGLSR